MIGKYKYKVIKGKSNELSDEMLNKYADEGWRIIKYEQDQQFNEYFYFTIIFEMQWRE